MKFEDALKKLSGDSVGGQLIVHRGGKNVLVGKSVQGMLIVADTDEAKLIAAEIGIEAIIDVDDEPAPVPQTHDLNLDDKVEMSESLAPPKPTAKK